MFQNCSIINCGLFHCQTKTFSHPFLICGNGTPSVFKFQKNVNLNVNVEEDDILFNCITKDTHVLNEGKLPKDVPMMKMPTLDDDKGPIQPRMKRTCLST